MIGATLRLDANLYHFLTYLKEKDLKAPIQFYLDGQINTDDAEIFSLEYDKFKNQIEDVYFHAPMKCNPGSSESRLLGYSKHLGKQAIEISSVLNAKAVIFHPGFNCQTLQGHLNLGRVMTYLSNLSEREGVQLLLENMAGQRNTLLGSLSHFTKLKRILPKVKFCIDTAHSFESGIDCTDFDKFLKYLDEIGLDRISLFHANDSRTDFCSRADRHETLGEGFIGNDFFKNLDKFAKDEGIPSVVELAGDIDKTIDCWTRSLANIKPDASSMGKKSCNLMYLGEIHE